eukprot:12883382-Alexandrium_andersonii.AAC.1
MVAPRAWRRRRAAGRAAGLGARRVAGLGRPRGLRAADAAPAEDGSHKVQPCVIVIIAGLAVGRAAPPVIEVRGNRLVALVLLQGRVGTALRGHGPRGARQA